MLDFLEKAAVAAAAQARKDAPVPMVQSPAEIAARVKEILAGYRDQHVMTPGDHAILDLVALGHPAVGALLQFLDSDDVSNHSGTYAAQNALASLSEESDVSAMMRMLRNGRTPVAHGLRKFVTPEVRDAFVDAIDSTFVDSDVVQGLSGHAGDAIVQKALCDWLRKPAALEQQWVVAGVGELLANAGAPGAAAALAPVLPKLTDLQPRQQVAVVLADLGEKSAIPVLIDSLTYADSFSRATRFDYPRHCAGLALNRISGTQLYTGQEIDGGGGGLIPTDPGPHVTQYDADWAGTAKAYREWWAKTKDVFRYDPATRTWSAN
jgi:hypothetical protein